MILDSTVSAVVTDGASGLGAATARALAAKGVKVALFDLQEAGPGLTFDLNDVSADVTLNFDQQAAQGANAVDVTLTEVTGALSLVETVHPAPGGPIRMTLCPPAAASSRARLIFSWPFTSLKSTSNSYCE